MKLAALHSSKEGIAKEANGGLFRVIVREFFVKIQ